MGAAVPGGRNFLMPYQGRNAYNDVMLRSPPPRFSRLSRQGLW